MVYSIAERVEVFALFFGNDKCANNAAELFNQQHADKHINRKYVLELVKNFERPGLCSQQKTKYSKSDKK